MDYKRYLRDYPDQNGFFGPYGGIELPPELERACLEIAQAYRSICQSSKFINELRRIRREFQGRPTPVYHCNRLSEKLGNCHIYLKREDLNHSGAHKLNHCMGEALLATYMGKKKIIAETLTASSSVSSGLTKSGATKRPKNSIKSIERRESAAAQTRIRRKIARTLSRFPAP